MCSTANVNDSELQLSSSVTLKSNIERNKPAAGFMIANNYNIDDDGGHHFTDGDKAPGTVLFVKAAN